MSNNLYGGESDRNWTYDTTDSIATILATGYFNASHTELRANDQIDVNISNGHYHRIIVTSVSAGVVTVSEIDENQVITNTPTVAELGTSHARTLTAAELGPNVIWTSEGSDAGFAFTLPAAVAGMEVVLTNTNQITTVDPDGTEVFEDTAGSDTADASLGAGGAGKYLSLPATTAFAHIKCYVDGVWTIVASRGVLSYEA